MLHKAEDILSAAANTLKGCSKIALGLELSRERRHRNPCPRQGCQYLNDLSFSRAKVSKRNNHVDVTLLERSDESVKPRHRLWRGTSGIGHDTDTQAMMCPKRFREELWVAPSNAAPACFDRTIVRRLAAKRRKHRKQWKRTRRHWSTGRIHCVKQNSRTLQE
jgi:hypothetical protein